MVGWRLHRVRPDLFCVTTWTIERPTIGRGESVEFEAWTDRPPPSSLFALTAETYDGSGQVVHPDHVTLPATLAIDPSALFATPYPAGNSNFENPSLFTSTNGLHWTTPAGRERLSIPAILARVTATDGASLLASSAAAMRLEGERPPALTNATAP